MTKGKNSLKADDRSRRVDPQNPTLEPGETILARFHGDLDDNLRFGSTIALLTNRRVLCHKRFDSSPARKAARPSLDRHEWPLAAVVALEASDRGGIGRLDIVGADGLLHSFRYTLRRASEARRFVAAYRAYVAGKIDETEAQTCDRCGAPLPPSGDPCACRDRAPTAHPARSLWRLNRFAKPRAHAIVLGFLLTIAGTAAGLVPPYLTEPLVDRVLIPRQNGQNVPFSTIYPYLFGLAAAAILAWLLSWARGYVMAWVSERIAADARSAVFAHLQKLSLEYFGGKRTGDLIARVSNDTDRICSYLSVNLVDFSSDLLLIGGTTVVLTALDPLLAAATLVPLPLIAWRVFLARDKLRRGFQWSGRVWSDMTSILADAIGGVRVVKAFAQEERENERFRRGNDHVLAANDRVNTIWASIGPMLLLLTQLGVLVVWTFGAWRVFGGRIEVGVLTAFITYIGRIYMRLESMSRIVQATQRAGVSSRRLFEILDREPTVADPADPVPITRPRGAISIRNVSFRYGERLVLDDVDLEINPGEMIGLVGLSGSGKSTLVNLICRFYDVSEGSIRFDGVDLRRLSMRDYRRRIGLVLQEPYLFYGTIAENIAYGRPDADRIAIVAAARAARAHEFILRLPDGYDSVVGERGQSLSGGERQRISIARALLIDPRVLILDEATSSVDTETERLIQDALEELVRGRTTIAIAHRLSTLAMADRIVVLDQGRVVEVGGHDELLERGGAYARLHAAQADPAQGRERASSPAEEERIVAPHVREFADN